MSAAVLAPKEEFTLPDCELTALAKAHGTPLYIYDLARLKERVAELRSALASANSSLFFATMANDQLPVLRLLANAGVGACVNSMPHFALATEAGFLPQNIQFTSTGISFRDMVILQSRGIRCNVDSLSQLEGWFRLGGTKAGVRINAASLGRGLNKDRIGIDASDLIKALAIAERFHCSITGLHIYLGTNFQRPDEMLPTLDSFFKLAAAVRNLVYLNIGGGIGVNYRHDGRRFDILSFGAGLADYAKELSLSTRKNIEIIFEPGRGLVAECGTFVTEVTDIKHLEGRRFVSVDGSIAVFPRPFHHPDVPHRIRKLPNGHADGNILLPSSNAVVVGRTTFSKDILGSTSLPSSLKLGDLLAFDDAGAYSQSMSSRFLGQPDPYVCFIN